MVTRTTLCPGVLCTPFVDFLRWLHPGAESFKMLLGVYDAMETAHFIAAYVALPHVASFYYRRLLPSMPTLLLASQ